MFLKRKEGRGGLFGHFPFLLLFSFFSLSFSSSFFSNSFIEEMKPALGGGGIGGKAAAAGISSAAEGGGGGRVAKDPAVNFSKGLLNDDFDFHLVISGHPIPFPKKEIQEQEQRGEEVTMTSSHLQDTMKTRSGWL